jgi:hypothetical protein
VNTWKGVLPALDIMEQSAHGVQRHNGGDSAPTSNSFVDTTNHARCGHELLPGDQTELPNPTSSPRQGRMRVSSMVAHLALFLLLAGGSHGDGGVHGSRAHTGRARESGPIVFIPQSGFVITPIRHRIGRERQSLTWAEFVARCRGGG